MRTEIRHIPDDPDNRPWHFYRERKGQLVFRAKFAEKYEAENCTRRIKKLRDSKTGRWYWKGDETIAGVRYVPRGDSKEEVETILASIRLRLRQGRYDLPSDKEIVTLAMLVAERVKDFDLEGSRYQRRVKVVLESFRNHFPPGQRVDRLTDADTLSFKRKRLAESKLKANSITHELEAIAAMFNAAGNYFSSLASWKHPAMHYEKAERRERVITRAEDASLLAELRKERQPKEQYRAHATRQIVADLWELAPTVGMRRGEMLRLEKGWIDFSEELLTLPKHVVKTRRSREVPLNEVALRILKRRCDAWPDCKFVFTNAHGTGSLGQYQMYRAIRKAALKAGLDYGRAIEGGFVLHDARHTAVTRMLQAGNDLATIGDVVGHSKDTMTLTYGHSTLESRRRAVASIVKPHARVEQNLNEREERQAKAKAAE